MPRLLAIAALAAGFLALLGPFGTWTEPLAERLSFWLVGLVICTFAGAVLARGLGRTPWLAKRYALLAGAVAAILTPVAAICASTAVAVVGRRQIDWPQFWRTMPEIGLVATAMCGLVVLLRGRRRAPLAPASGTDHRLDGLLPLKLAGARLLAMQAQDHYVRLYTDRGPALVLTSFDAALAKAADLDGRRVHRSWWVARRALMGVRRGDGRAVLELVGGVQAPVSRRYARMLRTEGWY